MVMIEGPDLMGEPMNTYEEFDRAKRDLWDVIITGLRLDRIVEWLAKRMAR